MPKTVKMVLAVLLGFVVWFAVATVGNFVIRAAIPGYAEVERTMAFTPTMLAARLILGVASSILAGLACLLALRSVPRVVKFFAAALVVFFLPVHYVLWAKFPAWYHVIFLVSLAPCVLLGAWIARSVIRAT